MTNEQEAHLAIIKMTFDMLVDNKYRKGQEEHGGNLMNQSEMSLVDSAIDEAIDQVVYLLTLKQKMLLT